MFSAESLREAYKRSVPSHVLLNEEFDEAEYIQSRSGDVVPVVPPPPGLEVDEVSLFVQLLAKGGKAPITERVYDHEFTPVTTDVPPVA